jgi:methoxymalonate biosynthesis acyl carrier protein
MPDDIQGDLKTFILNEFMAGESADSLQPDDDLLDLGLIDSMGALDIAGFIETSYGFKVEDEDINLANFRTVNNLARFVEGKLAGPGAVPGVAE